ncbi:multicopper oxidase family protein [Dyella flagellata]|uniref:multicopper oxidase family protein n=1 Tax=Dyella flagellata TaxID=1867833 RepID=UPI0024E0EE46|nr:multicopper oxidase [Dyella flagellata]
MSTRRDFLKWTVLGLGACSTRLGAHDMRGMGKLGGGPLCKHLVADQASVPRLLDPGQLKPFVDRLPLPPVLRADGTTLRVDMREAEQRLHHDLPPTRLWTYGGCMPGPSIEAQSGKVLRIDWRNLLPSKHFLPIDHRIHGAEKDQPEVRAVVHVHGACVPTASDGYPDDWYVPGQSRLHTYPNRQDAAALWYHDHAMGINRLNIYAGMFGHFIVRDEHEQALGLPQGEQEIPLTLSDRLLTTAAQLYYPVSGNSEAPWVSEVFGNAMLVNGALLPYLEVQPRRYRFRVLNASNARFFNLKMRDGRPFVQIGSDQGLLAAPVSLRNLFIAPGERADIVIDFAALAGQQLELVNDALPIMQFRVGSGRAKDASMLPAVLRDVPRMSESAATKQRMLTLDSYQDCVAEPMLMLLGGKRWHEPVTEKPVLGSTEIWNLVNLTDDTHPIHLHLVKFQILDRRPFDTGAWMDAQAVRYTGAAQAPSAGEAGWKDVVQAWPGMITRIIVRFDGYAGRYAWHCHLLEHEANEMMRPFEVVAA